MKTTRPSSRWDVPIRRRWLSLRNLTPPQLFVGSFLLLIVLGTIGFRMLPGLYQPGEEPLNWLDALFTATSAVCVTGLIVVSTPDKFSFAGQAYLLLLIQLGGLGMVAFTSMIIVALGRRLSLRHEAVSTSLVEAAPHVDNRRLIFDVVRFTLTLELIGAVLLYLCWGPQLGWDQALWHAVFHSVSAFCNAGFSTFPDSLESMRHSPLSLCIIMFLIVMGGIGFLTLEEIYLYWRAKKRRLVFRMSLHSRLVIRATVVLLLGGWLIFLITEWNITLGGLSFFNKIINALFMSVTARTAGFNTIDYTQAAEATCFLTILLMMIGGSPGSTAGGIKTTTFALLGIVAWSRFRGSQATNVWDRSIREETVNRTIGLVVVAVALVLFGIFLITLTEYRVRGEEIFLRHCFEVVSAFNTVGLSMDMTATISPIGRVFLIVLMFLGRVGPLTFASALAARYGRGGKFRYAYEEVVVG